MSLAMKARQRVRKKTVKDKIFGCDLLEHLQLSGQEVPQVLKSCAEFVEEHGIVDGIYRLCGIASNVQKLRQEFDIDRPPDLNKSTYLQDVHCVSSLCKAYFRELPNPLLTYQLYDKFADAVAIQLEEQRLVKIKEVLQELPLLHYRTLEYLMRHLLRMASYSSQTNMHTRNLAIVWAPNLLRSKDIESSGFNGTSAFMEVRVQSIVVEFILNHVEQLFGGQTSDEKENEGSSSASTKWSMPTCIPEDYYRSLSYNLPNMLNHGDGPPQIRPYHTIIDLTDHKRKGSLKGKKWKSIFNLGRSNPDSKRKSHKHDDKDGKSGKMSLRPAKSMDSLSSVPHTTHATDLEKNNLPLRSPRNQLSQRRESFGSPNKEDNIEFMCLDSEEPHSMDMNDAEYEEEEGQARSEPTTPKPGRSSLTGNPPSRSPKSNPSRAEKCVGVHISGPFSVTLPFHITSNLSRLTRGMECPGLSILAPHKGSENFSLEGNMSAEHEDPNKARPCQVPDKDQHSGTEEQGKENGRISLEVQDTFSFLDAQDTSAEKIAENTVDSEMLGYDQQTGNKMEEFSVEPPPEDLCEENEAGQAYFMPIGFVNQIGHWQVMQDSLEDIYLSAHDDLSPITQNPNLEPCSEEPMEQHHCIGHENLLTDPGGETIEEDQLRTYVSGTQEQSLMASETQCNGTHKIVVDDDGQRCNKDHRSTGEHEDSGTPNNKEDTIIGEPRCSQEHNMDIPNPADREALTAPKEMQHDDPDHKDDTETVNSKELDGPVAPGPEGVENDPDCTVEPHHPMQGKDILEAPETSQEPTACVTDLNTVSPKATLENEDSKELNAKIRDSYDEVDTLPKNTSDHCLSRNTPSLGHKEMVEQQSYCAEDGSAKGPESTAKDQGFSDEDPLSEGSVGHEHLPDDINMKTSEDELKDSLQQRPPPEDSTAPEKMYPDGSVAMKLMATTNKIQQVKSVPVVPPKPQFTKLPSALKTKIQVISSPHPLQTPEKGGHMDMADTSTGTTLKTNIQVISSPHPLQTPEKGGHIDTADTSTGTTTKTKIQAISLLSSNRDTRSQMAEKSSHTEAAETPIYTSLMRRSSWRNTTSISFDTAMTKAKERQSQNPVRRMQTYCIGDSYDLMDNTPHAPRFTVKSASSRIHRPFSCKPMPYGEGGELPGPNAEGKETMHGLKSIFTHEPDAYSKEVPHSNRLSMPRLGQPPVGDDQSKCHQQRRSLL
ncbi:rho GTPase-activating protein 30 [Hyla sarda]|uniref:rho GTPase-activating protein 30 n=1 Tax=Hyla sarda TaxID=327740 RepID=UPI0024C440D2|nr:rho GTPase-activating protein 30 [Hyla sarda]